MAIGRYRNSCFSKALALIVLCGACLPAMAQRMVFAHYMLANQDYSADDPTGERNIASYEREIRQAQAVGIDGFALNAGGWLKEPRYIRRASEMFEAAYRLHSGFKLMFSADMCCSNDADDVEDMVRRFANNPRYASLCFKHDGKFVLSTFAGSSRGPGFWRSLKKDIETGAHPSTNSALTATQYANGVPSSAPLPLELVPAFFWGGELPKESDIRDGLAQYEDIIGGAFYWGIAGVPGLGHPPDQIPSSEMYAATLHAARKIYMAPICFQFWAANAGRYYNYNGYSGMRELWMDAINVSHPDWVEIITWNDFVEGTYVSPIDDAARYVGANDLERSADAPPALHFFHSHQGARNLLSFFIAWYKIGREPRITTDHVFWAYHTELGNQSLNGKVPTRLYGNLVDKLYITANLTAPAVLHVSIGPMSRSIDLPAGSTDAEVPLKAGPPPHFELARHGLHLAKGNGDDPISDEGVFPDFYYSTGSMHD